MEEKNYLWIINFDTSRTWDRKRFICPVCDDFQTYGKTNFCPNCGADMRGEDFERKSEN